MKFSSDGHILLFGDFNAKIYTDPDYIIDNSPDNSLLDTGPLFNIDLSDNINKFDTSRNNQDLHSPDTYGKKLLDLCKTCDLRIANGRLLGDHLGYYTCYNHVGMPSVIDYLLIDLNFIQSVKMFHVHPLQPLSIHCCISAMINYHPIDTKVKLMKKLIYLTPKRRLIINGLHILHLHINKHSHLHLTTKI